MKKYQDKESMLERLKLLYPNTELNLEVEFYLRPEEGEEKYNVSLEDDRVTIVSSTEAGLLYGLIDYSQHNKELSTKSIARERGFNVDCGRKYFTKDWFLKIIRRMARLKMNVLQMHFSDNEGFRLELNRFKEVLSDHYLSQEDIKEILDYAKHFFIEVQPSFDSPGHMEKILDLYPQYRLENSKTGLDITNQAARDFVKSIYDAVLESFPDAKTIHMGGDEFIPFDDYHKYPVLEAYAKKQWGEAAHGFDTFIDYINDIADHLFKKNMKVKVWNDGLYRINQEALIELDPRLIVTYWTSWNKNMAPLETFKAKGHQLVNFMDQLLYFVLGDKAGYIDPTKESINNNFSANHFPLRHEELNVERVQSIDLEDPQFLGSFYSVWSDEPELMSETEVYEKTSESMKAFAQKLWEEY